MKANASSSRLGSPVIAILLCVLLCGAFATDPNLTITRSNQTVFITWFADAGVVYQLESSQNLTDWTNFGPATTGTGNFVNIPDVITGQTRGFYRLKRLPGTAVFNPATGVLTITGDQFDNPITVSRDAAGNLRVDGGNVPIAGGTPTVANTTLIEIFGREGNDVLSLDETNGALPRANLFGEGGNDTLVGGSGADTLSGGLGND